MSRSQRLLKLSTVVGLFLSGAGARAAVREPSPAPAGDESILERIHSHWRMREERIKTIHVAWESRRSFRNARAAARRAVRDFWIDGEGRYRLNEWSLPANDPTQLKPDLSLPSVGTSVRQWSSNGKSGRAKEPAAPLDEQLIVHPEHFSNMAQGDAMAADRAGDGTGLSAHPPTFIAGVIGEKGIRQHSRACDCRQSGQKRPIERRKSAMLPPVVHKIVAHKTLITNEGGRDFRIAADVAPDFVAAFVSWARESPRAQVAAHSWFCPNHACCVATAR
jgi:hypothetical protein